MKSILLSLIIGLSISCSLAQSHRITIERGGSDLFFSTIDDVINNTQNGDTIKFPGGSFLIPGGTWTVDQELHIFGVGYRADSSIATSPTLLIGDIEIDPGAEFGEISGVYITRDLWVETSDYTVTRCYINQKIRMNTSANDNQFYENVIIGNPSSLFGSVLPGSTTGNLFSNNIFVRKIWGVPGAGTIFSHNLFLTPGHPVDASIPISNVTFDHNIFMSTQTAPDNVINNCFYVENMFVSDWTGNFGSNSNVNNIFNQTASSIFIDQTGDQFDLGHDYHLQTSSPGYMGGGMNQVGIYGGQRPFKDSGHPVMPRIIEAEVGNSTDSNGQLQIKFTIEAQNN